MKKTLHNIYCKKCNNIIHFDMFYDDDGIFISLKGSEVRYVRNELGNRIKSIFEEDKKRVITIKEVIDKVSNVDAKLIRGGLHRLVNKRVLKRVGPGKYVYYDYGENKEYNLT